MCACTDGAGVRVARKSQLLDDTKDVMTISYRMPSDRDLLPFTSVRHHEIPPPVSACAVETLVHYGHQRIITKWGSSDPAPQVSALPCTPDP